MRGLPTGVYQMGEKVRVHITVKGKNYHLGTFASVEEASTVFRQAKKMADDLRERFSNPEIEIVEVNKYIQVPYGVVKEVERPSIWSRLFPKK